MAGVEVNNISGAPGGGGTRVVVRGYNSLMNGTTSGEPLYVVWMVYLFTRLLLR